MAAQTQPKTVFLTLDGDDLKHTIDLQFPLKTTHNLSLVEYSFIGVPMAGLVAIHDYYMIDFKGSGLELATCHGEVPTNTGHPLLLFKDSTNTLVNYCNGIMIGRATGSSVTRFGISIQDETGAPHHPVSNRLFEKAYIKFIAIELGMAPNPLILQSAPTVVHSYNT